ncbi:MAG: DUF2460 domain-containing protein [Pseudomonadota bacterium]
MAAFQAFHDVSFPVPVARGARVTAKRQTEIVTLGSGHEERSTRWRYAKRTFDAGGGLRSIADLHAVQAFFDARMGQLYSFRFRDPLDNRSCAVEGTPSATDQPLGVGDGTTTIFPLSKSVGAAPERPVLLPVPGSVSVAVDGVATSAFSIGDNGAVVFSTPPTAGAALSAGFLFDVPTRFDTDALDIDLTAFRAGSMPTIPLIEVFLREAADA